MATMANTNKRVAHSIATLKRAPQATAIANTPPLTPPQAVAAPAARIAHRPIPYHNPQF